MMLNATLLLQGIHFLVVYYIMARLFFRPACQELVRERYDEHVRSESLRTLEEFLSSYKVRFDTDKKVLLDRLVSLMPKSGKRSSYLVHESPPKPIPVEFFSKAEERIVVDALIKAVDAV
jgi:hypothetical protein